MVSFRVATVVSAGMSRERRSASRCVGAVMVKVIRLCEVSQQTRLKEGQELRYKHFEAIQERRC